MLLVSTQGRIGAEISTKKWLCEKRHVVGVWYAEVSWPMYYIFRPYFQNIFTTTEHWCTEVAISTSNFPKFPSYWYQTSIQFARESTIVISFFRIINFFTFWLQQSKKVDNSKERNNNCRFSGKIELMSQNTKRKVNGWELLR